MLVPRGRCIVTDPADGLFSVLEPANVRFRLPRPFAFITALVGGCGPEAGYEDQAYGVVWHHHISRTELGRLFTQHVEVEWIRWRAVALVRPCGFVECPFYRRNGLDHPMFTLIHRIKLGVYSVDPGECRGDDVLVVFRQR